MSHYKERLEVVKDALDFAIQERDDARKLAEHFRVEYLRVVKEKAELKKLIAAAEGSMAALTKVRDDARAANSVLLDRIHALEERAEQFRERITTLDSAIVSLLRRVLDLEANQ